MPNDFRYFTIMLVSIVFISMLAGAIKNFSMISSGLEECPNLLGYTGDTIWVKNCSDNMSNQKKILQTEDTK